MFRIAIDVYHHDARDAEQADRIESKLDRAIELLLGLRAQGNEVMAKIDELLADVQAESTLIDGIGTLIQGLKDQITAANGDAAKIEEAFAVAEQNKAKLAAALTANTSEAPPA